MAKKGVTVTALQAEKLLELLDTGFSGDYEEAKRLLRQRIADEKAKALAKGKIEVDLAFRDGVENKRIIGEAVGDHFAVCPPTESPRSRTNWQVIHRPSGLRAAGGIKCKRDALRAAEAFEAIPLPWASKRPLSDVDTDEIARMRDIATAVQNGRPIPV